MTETPIGVTTLMTVIEVTTGATGVVVEKDSSVISSTSESAIEQGKRLVMSRRRRAVLSMTAAGLFGVLLLFVGVAQSASASTSSPMNSAPTPAVSATPLGIDTTSPSSPTPTPTPTETAHEKKNVEQKSERKDLGFAALLVIIGVGFILLAGAFGVLTLGHQRRLRDRAEAAAASEDKGGSEGV